MVIRGDMRKFGIHLVVVAAVVTVTAAGCGTQDVGDLRTESRLVEVGDAKSARVNLGIGLGELQVTGGADPLIEGDFVYNVADWEPEIAYDVANGEGDLTVEQGSDSSISLGEARNEWDLRLNDEIPTTLDVEAGAGETRLDLDSLTLTELNLDVGAGSSTVDLTGDYEQDVNVTIDGGAGNVTLKLPSQIGVRIDADSGVGEITAEGLQREGDSYVNEAYGNSEVTLEATVDLGAGNLNLQAV